MFDSATYEVPHSDEVDRVARIPRRVWDPALAQSLRDDLSDALRKPGGTMRLKVIQTLALIEMAKLGGALLPIRVGGGKLHRLSEPVLLDRGWTPIGDVVVGDRIYGSDGCLHMVTGVFPQGKHQQAKLTFSDGSWSVSGLEHLWTFRTNNGPGKGTFHTRTLREWMEVPLYRQTSQGKAWTMFLPMVEPIQYPEADLPLDPYTLGALIGDGGLSQITLTFTSMDRDIVGSLVLPDDVQAVPVSHQNSGRATSYRLTSGREGTRNPLPGIIRSLGLNCTSHRKFIPEQYKRGSVEQRLELLRGLLDTDGEACKGGRAVDFSSVSERLALDVQELVESLGGSATLRHRREGQWGEHYRLSVRLPSRFNPFKCARKRDLYEAWRGRLQRPPGRSLRSIELLDGEEESVCISVSAPDQLYVTRHHILTHNTLISLLAPRMFPECKRPLLLIPAHLREKTERERVALAKHWHIPEFVRIESYQKLSRIGAADLLEEYQPDLIIADEAHYLKNPSAACTKRLARYLKPRFNKVRCVFMSGTFVTRSIRDVAHLSNWALKKNNPYPADFVALQDWSNALDPIVPDHQRLAPGALAIFRSDPREDIRKAFQRRVVESPGVIATQESPLDIKLTVRSHLAPECRELAHSYRDLREQWVTPDGWAVADGASMWRHARELANGFYSVWDPRPPDDWMEARTAWYREARHIIANNHRNIDTELQARIAVEDGTYPKLRETLLSWLSVQDTFTPNPKAVWVSNSTVDWIAQWAGRNGPALLWTDRPALGRKLEERFGLKYYGQGGFAADGSFVEDHDPETQGSAVLSIDANKEGRNLQHRWSRNLVLDVPQNNKQWEQMLGRTHRDGQRSPEVTVDVLFGCIEDVAGFWRAVEMSRVTEDLTGQAQKLSNADIEKVVDETTAAGYSGYQWMRSTPQC